MSTMTAPSPPAATAPPAAPEPQQRSAPETHFKRVLGLPSLVLFGLAYRCPWVDVVTTP